MASRSVSEIANPQTREDICQTTAKATTHLTTRPTTPRGAENVPPQLAESRTRALIQLHKPDLPSSQDIKPFPLDSPPPVSDNGIEETWPSNLPLKATPGFEPGVEVLQTSALPLGDVAALSSF